MFTAPGYETKERLYESDNSIIYRAVGLEPRRPVILKVLKAMRPPPELIARFKREYSLTKELAAPGVIDVYDLVQTENHWLIVEEDFGGESLRRQELAGTIGIEPFLELAIATTEILADIHREKVIHKDINPSNIVSNPQANVVKIIDFGISASKLAEESVSFDHPTRLEGTPGYLAPEQTGRLNRPLDYRSDFYSLGCTFYHLLTGQLPFSTDDLLELIHSHLARTAPAAHELRDEVPPVLSAIVARLMAKNPDERYQSAHGLKADLEICLREYRGASSNGAFELGRHDVASEFRLPARLYGRERERDHLRRAFDQVCAGETRVTLVTGYSGIGKSALVKELYESITEHKGFFVSGKFEQYERNVPYAPIVQAFQALIQQLLCESQDEIARWRDELLQAIGPTCAALIEVIPQLELVTGALPPLAALPPGDAHFRFTRAMRELVRAFARAEHPLVLFLDDLQWSDSASLDLIENLTTADKSPFLFLIGAYRDNEVGVAHPLRLTLANIEIAESLHLEALEESDVGDMLVDALDVSPSKAQPLAELVHGKTAGNPFFIGQFLKALHGDGLIRFDHDAAAWDWDMEQVRLRDISDNVVELLIDKIHDLPADTQSLLQWMACIGNRFDLRTLTIVRDRPAGQITADLMPAISEDFVLPMTGHYRLFEAEVDDLELSVDVAYKFAHDRIQQAAYTMVSEAERKQIHLHIGRRLRQASPQQLLEILGQLNAANELIGDPDERREIARLNLQAGAKAKSAAANESSFEFLTTGLSFLGPALPAEDGAPVLRLADADAFARDYELALSLTEQAADAAYLMANFEAMERLSESGLAHAQNWEDKVEIYQVRINALSAQNRFIEAIDMAREILAHLGIDLPREPGQADIDEAMGEVDRLLDGRSPQSLHDLPRATSESHRTTLRILDSIHQTTTIVQQALGPIVAARMVRLTLLHGLTENSINGLTYYGTHLCAQGEIQKGYEFGLLARAVFAADKNDSQLAELNGTGYYFMFHWKEPIRVLIEDMERGYRAGLDTGRLTGAIGCFANATTMAPLLAGYDLEDVDRRARTAVDVAERHKQGAFVVWIRVYWQFARNFIHEHEEPHRLKGEIYDEYKSLPIHAANQDDLTIQLVYIMKCMLCCRFGKYRDAVTYFQEHVEKKYSKSGVLLPPCIMYYALAQIELYAEEQDAAGREAILSDVDEKRSQLKAWAEHGPTNYAHKFHLVEAELARVLGDDRAAREHYDRSIDLARAHQYLNEESLALERAALFFRERGNERLAGYYLRDAYYAYQRWRAGVKVEELRRRYPELLVDNDVVPRRSRFGGPARGGEGRPEQRSGSTLSTGALPDLDLEAVLRASRAIGAEHEQAGLLRRIMRICLEYAGARRGFLILARHGELIVKASGALDEDAKVQLESVALEDRSGLSHGVVRYVAKTTEPVVLTNALEEGMFKGDLHVRETACRSLLCVPILYQGTLVGITYMENNHTIGAFKEDHLEVLGLLMTQAAVSIENAWLRSADADEGFRFTVGGSLAEGTLSYVRREADRQLTQRVGRGEFCYVFNARQMGKSSLRVHTMAHLVRGGARCAAIDLTAIGSETLTVEQWYAGIARALISGLGLGQTLRLRSWWRERAFLSPVQRVADLLDEILTQVSEPIIVFIDEIDMVISLDFGLDDFFALIRALYNRRVDDARYARLTFVLLGVATPTDLIRDKTRTPFNIGHAIRMAGFSYAEARMLTRGLDGFDDPERVLKAILTWTGGQPFLTQKLCQFARQSESQPGPGKERDWVAKLVRDQVLNAWRVRDEPEHLKTIEARILRSPNRDELLALYDEILARGGVATTEGPLESELVLSGLVASEWGRLRVGNLIYASVFGSDWVTSNRAQPHPSLRRRS